MPNQSNNIMLFPQIQVSNQEAVDVVRASCLGIDRQQPLLACKKLVELSVSRGSCDDISVMVIQLGCYI